MSILKSHAAATLIFCDFGMQIRSCACINGSEDFVTHFSVTCGRGLCNGGGGDDGDIIVIEFDGGGFQLPRYPDINCPENTPHRAEFACMVCRLACVFAEIDAYDMLLEKGRVLMAQKIKTYFQSL